MANVIDETGLGVTQLDPSELMIAEQEEAYDATLDEVEKSEKFKIGPKTRTKFLGVGYSPDSIDFAESIGAVAKLAWPENYENKLMYIMANFENEFKHTESRKFPRLDPEKLNELQAVTGLSDSSILFIDDYYRRRGKLPELDSEYFDVISKISEYLPSSLELSVDKRMKKIKDMQIERLKLSKELASEKGLKEGDVQVEILREVEAIDKVIDSFGSLTKDIVELISTHGEAEAMKKIQEKIKNISSGYKDPGIIYEAMMDAVKPSLGYLKYKTHKEMANKGERITVDREEYDSLKKAGHDVSNYYVAPTVEEAGKSGVPIETNIVYQPSAATLRYNVRTDEKSGERYLYIPVEDYRKLNPMQYKYGEYTLKPLQPDDPQIAKNQEYMKTLGNLGRSVDIMKAALTKNPAFAISIPGAEIADVFTTGGSPTEGFVYDTENSQFVKAPFESEMPIGFQIGKKAHEAGTRFGMGLLHYADAIYSVGQAPMTLSYNAVFQALQPEIAANVKDNYRNILISKYGPLGGNMIYAATPPHMIPMPTEDNAIIIRGYHWISLMEMEWNKYRQKNGLPPAEIPAKTISSILVDIYTNPFFFMNWETGAAKILHKSAAGMMEKGLLKAGLSLPKSKAMAAQYTRTTLAQKLFKINQGNLENPRAYARAQLNFKTYLGYHVAKDAIDMLKKEGITDKGILATVKNNILDEFHTWMLNYNKSSFNLSVPLIPRLTGGRYQVLAPTDELLPREAYKWISESWDRIINTKPGAALATIGEGISDTVRSALSIKAPLKAKYLPDNKKMYADFYSDVFHEYAQTMLSLYEGAALRDSGYIRGMVENFDNEVKKLIEEKEVRLGRKMTRKEKFDFGNDVEKFAVFAIEKPFDLMSRIEAKSKGLEHLYDVSNDLRQSLSGFAALKHDVPKKIFDEAMSRSQSLHGSNVYGNQLRAYTHDVEIQLKQLDTQIKTANPEDIEFLRGQLLEKVELLKNLKFLQERTGNWFIQKSATPSNIFNIPETSYETFLARYKEFKAAIDKMEKEGITDASKYDEWNKLKEIVGDKIISPKDSYIHMMQSAIESGSPVDDFLLKDFPTLKKLAEKNKILISQNAPEGFVRLGDRFVSRSVLAPGSLNKKGELKQFKDINKDDLIIQYGEGDSAGTVWIVEGKGVRTVKNINKENGKMESSRENEVFLLNIDQLSGEVKRIAISESELDDFVLGVAENGDMLPLGKKVSPAFEQGSFLDQFVGELQTKMDNFFVEENIKGVTRHYRKQYGLGIIPGKYAKGSEDLIDRAVRAWESGEPDEAVKVIASGGIKSRRPNEYFQHVRESDDLADAIVKGYEPIQTIGYLYGTRSLKHFQRCAAADLVEPVIKQYAIKYKRAGYIPFSYKGKEYYIPQEMQTYINRSLNLSNDPVAIRRMLGVYDFALNFYKGAQTSAAPGFPIRNFTGDRLRMYMYGLDTNAYMTEAAYMLELPRLMELKKFETLHPELAEKVGFRGSTLVKRNFDYLEKKWGSKYITVDGTGEVVTYKRMMEEALSFGVTNSGWIGSDTASYMDQIYTKYFGNSWGKLKEFLRENKFASTAVISGSAIGAIKAGAAGAELGAGIGAGVGVAEKVGGWLARYTEALHRIELWMWLRKRGVPPSSIPAKISEILIDYSPRSKTATEKWIGRVVPFWTWLKNNTLTQLTQAFRNPRHLGIQGALYENLNDKFREDYPEVNPNFTRSYLTGLAGVPIWWDPESDFFGYGIDKGGSKSIPFLYAPDLPSMSIGYQHATGYDDAKGIADQIYDQTIFSVISTMSDIAMGRENVFESFTQTTSKKGDMVNAPVWMREGIPDRLKHALASVGVMEYDMGINKSKEVKQINWKVDKNLIIFLNRFAPIYRLSRVSGHGIGADLFQGREYTSHQFEKSVNDFFRAVLSACGQRLIEVNEIGNKRFFINEFARQIESIARPRRGLMHIPTEEDIKKTEDPEVRALLKVLMQVHESPDFKEQKERKEASEK